MPIPMPAWLDELPDDEKPAARAKFLLKVCALYATPEGKLLDLSTALGYSHRTLHQLTATKSPMNVNVAVALEKLLGREVITREIALPELFDITA